MKFLGMEWNESARATNGDGDGTEEMNVEEEEKCIWCVRVYTVYGSGIVS